MTSHTSSLLPLYPCSIKSNEDLIVSFMSACSHSQAGYERAPSRTGALISANLVHMCGTLMRLEPLCMGLQVRCVSKVQCV